MMLKLEILSEHDPLEVLKGVERVLLVVMVGVQAVDGDVYG